MASFFCPMFGGTKWFRLERIVRAHLADKSNAAMEGLPVIEAQLDLLAEIQLLQEIVGKRAKQRATLFLSVLATASPA